MPLYSYRAVDHRGRKSRGRADAGNLLDLESRLRRRGLELIDGQPWRASPLWHGARLPRRELIQLCFHLEQLTRAGVPLVDGLTDLRDSIEETRVRALIASLIESVEGGRTLSQAMAAHPRDFSPVVISLIRAGEHSGTLPDILHTLGETQKWEDELAAQTRKALLYPAFVAIVTLAATAFLMLYLVPPLKQFVLNMGHTLPMHTRVLFFLADAVGRYGAIAGALLLLGALTIRLALARNAAARTRADALLLRLPRLGELLRKLALARFASTFAVLYGAGIPITDALRLGGETIGNRAIRAALTRASQQIGEGSSLSLALQSATLFPPLVIRMLRIGEATGTLEHALHNIHYFYSRDVRESVDKMQQLLEPVLTVLLGALLGWVMLSVLGPVYDIISQLKL
ncbi:type II secretion system F family protein [Rhodocyclus gracilis]|uniref:Type II secretion system F family protein n=1 Tax=Rhodocyclus tenuis TaxID=1066 RepID=A0A6L5JZ51_RHOTE|nr:type II secretion system F family protein [Rhodocyclus gracilis]MQY52625.1 type II secretion system F family protein [Rhodocyclus gracilis]